MVAAAQLNEYRDQIRKHVCSRCVERPPGGPPCEPLGKMCGVELHLPELIDSIHQVHSDFLQPYLEHNRCQICQGCEFLHSKYCPCPMDYLSALLVEAVETVDERLQSRLVQKEQTARVDENVPGIDEIYLAYQEASGLWSGCDWPTRFGETGLDLNGCTAAEAEVLAQETANSETGDDWKTAAAWLAQIQRFAERAEDHAFRAISAVLEGDWQAAQEEAERAWALEFASGRPVWRKQPPTWRRLRQMIEAACAFHRKKEVASGRKD